jgi:hypothetical protein
MAWPVRYAEGRRKLFALLNAPAARFSAMEIVDRMTHLEIHAAELGATAAILEAVRRKPFFFIFFFCDLAQGGTMHGRRGRCKLDKDAVYAERMEDRTPPALATASRAQTIRSMT